MTFYIRPMVAAVGIALAFSAQAAKPSKPAAKPVASAATAAEFELAHNLGPIGAQHLQEVVDRFNAETGGTMKVVRLEKGQKPTGLNFMSRYDMAEVLAHPKSFMPLHE